MKQKELASYAKRTLQRRLDEMIQSGLVRSEGAGRGFCYHLVEAHDESLTPVSNNRLQEDSINYPVPARDERKGDWLSPASKELRAAVTRPIQERRSAPYNDSLLIAYQPNVTEYLSPALRQDLAKMGKVGMEDHPAGTYLRQVMDRLIIDLSWNSSRLEGNTYSILETQRLFEMGEGADGKSLAEAQMILNHKNAIEILADMSDEAGFNRYTLFNLHAALAEGLLPHEEASGRLRHEPVGVTGTSFEPLQDPARIEENFERILLKAEAIENPFEQAFFSMVHLPYLQPFIDVNKRTSRIVANIPLMKHNLCPLAFVGVSREDYLQATLALYELRRVEYLRDVFVSAYQKSCDRYSAIRQVLGDPNPLYVRYRRDVHRYIQHVVGSNFDKKQAIRWIHDECEREIAKENRAAFIELVETVLSSLHEGNIARYRLRPGPFREWLAGWR
ncbi:Fic family protein [Haloferula chungangensis]|uniref:Fic family protein n=1 Tax=Haloferula chungangensis TaxID=1048331 RepID=A0ABW2LAX4_9BACT